MKFTEEQAREALRAELTNKGRKSLAMSERTLAKMTESLIKRLADDEIGLPDFVEIAVEILNPVNDNIRKDKSDFANEWKKEHSEPEPKKDDKGAEEPPKSGENAEIKALMERIAALEKDKAEASRQSTIAQKKEAIIAKLREKGVKDEEWMSDFLSEVNISEDLDVDAKADSWIKLYNRSKANGGGAVPPVNPNTPPTDSTYAQSLKEAAALAKQERAIIENKNQ